MVHSIYLTETVAGDPYCKLLLYALCDYINDDGICRVSIRNLTLDCECSEATVRRKLHELRDKGLITITEVIGQPNIITLVGFKELVRRFSGGAKNVCTN